MAKATFDVLSEADKQLVLETEPQRLRALDEDALLELHRRVRRSRTKHRTNHRRGASAQVATSKGRGRPNARVRRDAARAEVLESALARVSRQLAVAARAAAEELRRARLDAGAARRKAKQKAKARAKAKAKDEAAARAKAKQRSKAAKAEQKAKAKAEVKSKGKGKAKASPGRSKRDASTKASGKRRQAARDGRKKR